LVRGDDSSYHTFYFDPATGEAIRGGTEQGYLDGSTWTRGQAWGIYGFALSYRNTGNLLYLETSKRMARYFVERLPEDNVV
jgi:unsaturated chondroitin disaccharide hydrolase